MAKLLVFITTEKCFTFGSPIKAIPTQSFLFCPPLRVPDTESLLSNRSTSFKVFSTFQKEKY